MAGVTGRVLVLGASGETGRHVIAALERKQIAARALARDEEKAQTLRSSTTQVLVGETNPAMLHEALQDVTAIISTIGTRVFHDPDVIQAAEYTTVVDAIAAAREHGVTHFVLCSSMGTNAPDSIPLLSDILRVKRQAEEALEASGLNYTIVHPGGLRNEPGGESVLVASHPLTLRGTISREDVAEVLVQALLQAEARNKSVDVIQQAGHGPADRSGLFA